MLRKLSPIAQDNEDARAAGLTYGQHKAPPVLVFIPVLPLAAQVPSEGGAGSSAFVIRFLERPEPERRVKAAGQKRQVKALGPERQAEEASPEGAEPERRCIICGKPLRGKQRMYCGKNCANAHFYQICAEQDRLERPELRCVICGAGLTGKQRKFCGTRCRNAYHHRQRRKRVRGARTEEQA